MREDVLEADEPHQDPLIGLLVQGVTDDMEFDHAPALLQTGGFVTGRVSRQQTGLLGNAKPSCRSTGPNRVTLNDYLWNGSGIRDGRHDFVDEVHGDVTQHPGSLVLLVVERLRGFALFSNYNAGKI